MRTELGICAKCGHKRYIVNRKYWLCQLCNHERLHGTSFTKPTPIKRSPIRRKHKPTGEKKVFDRIWEKRSHRSELSGRSVQQFENTDWYKNLFAHILSKLMYPKFRLKEQNIMIVHPDEHTLLDQGTEAGRREYEVKYNMSFQPFYDKQKELKNEYKNLTQ